MDGHAPHSRSQRLHGRLPGDPAATGMFVTATDAGIAAAVFVLPFVMGGRQAWGHFLLGMIACWTALNWALHQMVTDRPRWRWSGAEPLFGLGVALLILQCVHLPQSTLHQISPALEERLPMWTEGSEFGVWSTISLTPQDTLANLMPVASCMLLFITVVQRLQRVDDVKRLLTWIGSSAAAMAAFGVVQLLFGNGKFFWFYEHPFTDTLRIAKGAFSNANHFAHFIALGIPIWLWRLVSGEIRTPEHSSDGWRLSRERDRRRSVNTIVSISCLGAIGLGLLLSQSRGGIMVGAGGAGLTLLFLWRQKMVGAGTVVTVSAIGAVCCVCLLAFGNKIEGLVEQSLSELATTDVNKLDEGEARRKIWSTVFEAAKSYPILGTGLGSHVEVYPTFHDAPDTGVEYTHAENGYLQIAMETGMSGLSIAVLFIFLIAYCCLRGLNLAGTTNIAPPLAAITGSLAMNVAHSMADFIWYVPGCMASAVLLAGSAVRMYQLSIPPLPAETAPSGGALRTVWATAAAAVLAFAAFTIRVEWPAVAAEPHWFEYIRMTRAFKTHGEDDETSKDIGLIKRRLVEVVMAARANPSAHRIQLAAARAYWQYVQLKQEQSDNPMPLAQLKDAARSNFESVEEMQEWLAKPGVLGDRQKLLQSAKTALHRSLDLCPLSARAYLMLSDLAWLEGGTEEQEHEYVAQAFEVRPYDARVHYVLGREKLTDPTLNQQERLTEAVAHWREAFDRDPAYRKQLISGLSGLMPASFFLESFEPDLDSLKMLRVAYKESPDERGYRSVLQKLAAEECKEGKDTIGEDAVTHWIAASSCFAELGDARRAIAAAEAAVKANPVSFTARNTLGIYLYNHGDYEQASEHLAWCVKRRPDDAQLRQRAENAMIRANTPSARMAREQDDDTLTR